MTHFLARTGPALFDWSLKHTIVELFQVLLMVINTYFRHQEKRKTSFSIKDQTADLFPFKVTYFIRIQNTDRLAEKLDVCSQK